MKYNLVKYNNNFILDESLGCNIFAGNKFRKIRSIMQHRSPRGIISFGSPYSNHCLACSYYGIKNNIPVVILIIRNIQDNRMYPNINLSRRLGAEIFFIDKEKAYDQIHKYKIKYSNYFWIPGGGHLEESTTEYLEVLRSLHDRNNLFCNISKIILPFGTGTTAYGFAKFCHELNFNVMVIGISVSRSKELCMNSVLDFTDGKDVLKKIFIDDRFAGKYGNIIPGDSILINNFFRETGILVDPIYNVRLLRYIEDENIDNSLIVNTGGITNVCL